MTTNRLTRNDFSRLWLIEGKASPGNVPQYEGLWKAGAVSWTFGDVTPIFIPDPDQYGAFERAGEILGERGDPTLTVTGRYLMDVKSVLLEMARSGCDHDIQIHMGECKDPQDFNRGWEKILVLEAARVTQYGTTDLGALGPDERAIVNEEVPFSGDDLYEIVPILFGSQAASQIVQEVIDIMVCDRVTCGSCGLPASDGCSVVFALTLTAGGSPGLPAEVLYTEDGGGTWDDTNVTTLGVADDPNALSCVGVYLVVISEASESLHYALLAEIIAGTETWTEVTTGFVSTKGPLAIWSADARHTWIVGEGGYIYFTDDPTAGVEVQDSGSATAQDLAAVHGTDMLHVIAVGASNAVVVTSNGGSSWASVVGPAVGVNLTAVWMASTTEWLVGTADGRLFYTRDAGTHWTAKAFPGSGSGTVRDIVFSTPAVGWLAHDTATPAGRILRTIDGGASWYVAPEGNTVIPANDRINALAVCDDNANAIFGAGLADDATDGIIVKGA